ncbi:hypothetical protein K437DRAFT_231403 [Tilletiaria anomala UBC 951]|uniref:Eukaryotic translation initiation factor 3 subunit H n=1 Tax=Tilletiaria anomala (strain ATCC 24038 / CBS 436.72 / UBC 951) TaxID=1037660 RepID=A0A066WG84_TILAU|nr:uncharacterized protein K437DRAFT_231403 [Tilletiaria anomala UBC 951]KDN52977.1 hypothetical protein K437DRAFT_231403 [Tilletiaria anomala UBC 951]
MSAASVAAAVVAGASKPEASKAGVATVAKAAAGLTQAERPLTDLDIAALELVKSAKQAITSVRLDGLALAKIVKHSKDAHPSAATGALLGLEIAGALEVSNVFSLPGNALGSSSRDRGVSEDQDAEAQVGKGVTRYTSAMLSLLRDVNADANPVGLYYGCFLGAFLSSAVIDGLWAISSLMEREGTEGKGRAILLVHDLAQSAMGNTTIRAFRLAPSFIDAYRRGKFHTQALVDHKLTFSNVLVEIPVTLHNTALLDALLSTLSAPSDAAPSILPPTSASLLQRSTSAALDTSAALNHNLTFALPPVLSTSLESTLEALDEHASEAGNIGYQLRQLGREKARAEAYLSRRRAENALREQQGLPPLPVEDVNKLFKLQNEPSRLEGMMLLGQLDEAAKRLAETAAVGSVQLHAVKTGAI